MTARAGVLVLALVAGLASASCGVPLMKLPSGPGAPAPDAADVLAHATAACHAVRTLTAEIAVSGSAAGHRVRARLSAGVAAPSSARLEAVASFGPPVFIFVADGNDATLLLPRDGRVLEHGRPDAVLEAVAGVPLDASDLRVVLTGCAVAPDRAQARQLGDDWCIVPDGPNEIYLHRDPHVAPWRLVAAVHHGAGRGDWRAEYRDFQNGLPRGVHLTSVEPGRFDLRLTLSQVDVNVPLEADVFRVKIPKSAEPITLDELRRTGPLAPRDRVQAARGGGAPAKRDRGAGVPGVNKDELRRSGPLAPNK